jgi:MoaA/NifB/PqqE/SkfB family radical SAM enzyme
MGVRAIQLTGGGEPTLYPQFSPLINIIKEKGIEYAVVTNGLLAGKFVSHLADATWTRISIDSGSPETYAAIRNVPSSEYDIVLRNLEKISSYPNRKTVLGVGFVVTKENYKEIAICTKRVKEAGADNIRISALFQNDHSNYYNEIISEIIDIVSEAQGYQSPDFKVFNNFSSRYQDLVQERPEYQTCPIMHFTTYIAGNQKVYTCCVNAYNLRGEIGSIETQSFWDLWNSYHKKLMFSRFKAPDCPRCMFNDKNRAILKMLELPKSHENFV